jgi:hypothetical protein
VKTESESRISSQDLARLIPMFLTEVATNATPAGNALDAEFLSAERAFGNALNADAMTKEPHPPQLRFAFGFFSVAITAFKILWTLIGLGMISICAWSISSKGAPLVVNGEQTSWLGTAGIIALVLIMILFGFFILSLVRRGLSVIRAHISQPTKRGN